MTQSTMQSPLSQREPGQNKQESSAISQNNVRNIGLITAREYKHRISQRSYKISTIILGLIVFIASLLPVVFAFFFGHTTTTQTHITIVNSAGPVANLNDSALSQYFSRALNGTGSAPNQTSSSTVQFVVKTAPANALNTLKSQVKQGKLDITLNIERTATNDLRFIYYTTASSSDTTNSTQVQNVANQLSILDKSARLGLTAKQTQNLFTPPAFSVVSNQASSDIGTRLSGYFLGLGGMLLVFISIMMYGISVATGVAEEKGTRIMEILINAASPFQLMAGKILGIGAAGLTQMVILAIVGIGGFLLQQPLGALLGVHTSSLALTFNSTIAMLFLLLLVYFILGFLLYSALYAAIGALIQRVDEVQNASGPVTTLLMIGYFASFASGIGGISSSVEPTWIRVLSLIPFFTPTMMMMRAGSGNAAPWEIGLSIVLLILAIVVCTWIAARIYRFGVLMYGQKPRLGQIIKIVRQ